jgi:hypothetical protein
VAELLVHLTGDGAEVDWPVAVVAESANDRSVVFRTYCSRWPVDGARHVRPPILRAGANHPGDVVGTYQDALQVGDVDATVRVVAQDGYYRGPLGRAAIYRGTGELQSFFTECFEAGGGIDLEHCTVTDDARRSL